MDTFKELYCGRCSSPIEWFEVGKVALIGPEVVHEAKKKVKLI